MSVAIEDVPVWLILDRQIGHAIGNTGSGWHQLACGIVTPNGALTKVAPTRICKKCRNALRSANLPSAKAG